MNIYDFINSRDIAKYLKEINYQFSTLECAWLVWQSCKHTLEQKYDAWQEIIDTMPDCSVEARPNHEGVDGLHGYLKNYMSFQQEVIKDFFELEPQMFYNGRAITNMGDDWDPSTYLSVEECIEHYKTDYGSYWAYPDSKIIGFEIEKFRIGQSLAEMSLSMDDHGNMLDVKARDKSNLFENLWFAFPTPFKKGDILSRVKHEYDWLFPDSFCRLFVMDSISTDNWETFDELKKNGTYKDMLAYGYRIYAGYDKVYSYMNLEYADGDSPDFDKEMLPISLFMKGQINVMEMAEAYRVLANERDLRKSRSSVLDDELMSILSIN